MRLVKPSFEIIEQQEGLSGMMKHMEFCGRTCYKSEDKITENSAEKFVNMIINRGHTAMLEHGTVYLTILDSLPDGFGGPASEEEVKMLEFYYNNEYSNVVERYIGIGEYQYYITTNYRVLLQNNRLDDLQYLCEPTECHVKRITVKFICDRGVSHEFVRHRVFSFAQESTRYCNYSKNKFGNECTFIIPIWYNTLLKEGQCYPLPYKDVFDNEGTLIVRRTYEETVDYNNPPSDEELNKYKQDNKLYNFLWGLDTAQQSYFEEIRFGNIAQQARAVLPNSLKTELVMTGTIDQWIGFFKLRDDEQHAHPQAYELAHPLHEEFIKRGYLQ